MPTYKTIIFLNSTGDLGCGWSETYWHERPSIEAAHAQAVSLAKQRHKLVCQDIFIAAVRTSDAAIRGDSVVLYTPEEGWGPAQWAFSRNPWNSYLYRLQSGTLYRSMHHIRGLDEDAFGKTNEITILVRQACDKFAAYLAKEQFRMRSHLKGDDNPPRKIANLTVDGTTHVATLDTVGAHGLAVGNQFRIYGGQFLNWNGNGTWQVSTVESATQFTFRIISTGPEPTWLAFGQVQKETIGYPIIDSGLFVRPSHKKVGRPFGVAPGRVGKRAAR